jgi:D-alanyl-D-alanine carboxypeptidase (penicillin-binding protein 5/6)
MEDSNPIHPMENAMITRMRKLGGMAALWAVVASVLLLAPPQAGAAETFTTSVPAAVLMDAATGEILYEQDIHTQYPPASMVKMMVALIVMEKVREGSLRLEDSITISGRAAKIGGSQVYLKQGEVFTLEELMKGLMIHSANDASTAIAETVAGSVEAFVDLMNLKAQEIGMKDTVFHSVHGLPPGKGQEKDLSSAHDMALLGRVLSQNPKILQWTSTVEEPFRGGQFTLHNTNKLLTRYKGMDGIKTGYIRESGFCITATAMRDSTRMIAVVMGAPTDAVRTVETTRLLTLGFNTYKTLTLATAGQPLKQRLKVKSGKTPDIGLKYASDLRVSVNVNKASEVVFTEELPEKIDAPVQEGAVVGKATAKLGDRILGQVDVVSAETNLKASLWERIF